MTQSPSQGFAERKRFALQVATFSGTRSVERERFVVYSVDTGEPVCLMILSLLNQSNGELSFRTGCMAVPWRASAI